VCLKIGGMNGDARNMSFLCSRERLGLERDQPGLEHEQLKKNLRGGLWSKPGFFWVFAALLALAEVPTREITE